MAAGNKVILVGCDGERVEVEVCVAMQSLVLKQLMEDLGVERPIPVEKVTGKTLILVMEHCEKLADEQTSKKLELLKQKALDEYCNLSELLKPNALDVLLAADYLDVQDLLRMSCNFVTDCITCSNNPDAIRDILNIKTKITPAEEEELSRENAWAFITPKEEGEEVRRGNSAVEQWLKICFLPEDDSKAAKVVQLLKLRCMFPTSLELKVSIVRLLWELNKTPEQTFLDNKVAYSSMLCNVATEFSYYLRGNEHNLLSYYIPRLYDGAKVVKEGHVYRGPKEPVLKEVDFYLSSYDISVEGAVLVKDEADVRIWAEDDVSAEDESKIRRMMKLCYRRTFKHHIIEEVKFAMGVIGL